MNDIIEELKEVADDEYEGLASSEQCRRALDLIEQKAARIRELEDSLLLMARTALERSEMADSLAAQLTALRSKIENAEVVAWEIQEISGHKRKAVLDVRGWEFADPKPLIRKEDLL